MTPNKQTIAFFLTKDLSTQHNYWAWQLLHTEGSVTLNSVLNKFYHVNLPNEVLLEHLSGICRMTHILKALRGIPTCLLQQNLFTSRMLNSQNRFEHFRIFRIHRLQSSLSCSTINSISTSNNLLVVIINGKLHLECRTGAKRLTTSLFIFSPGESSTNNTRSQKVNNCPIIPWSYATANLKQRQKIIQM